MPAFHRPEITLGMSVSATSRSLNIPLHVVNDAIDQGHLVLRQCPGSKTKMRLLVGGDGGIQQWAESWDRIQRKGK
jgi:hypothetical protein